MDGGTWRVYARESKFYFLLSFKNSSSEWEKLMKDSIAMLPIDERNHYCLEITVLRQNEMVRIFRKTN